MAVRTGERTSRQAGSQRRREKHRRDVFVQGQLDKSFPSAGCGAPSRHREGFALHLNRASAEGECRQIVDIFALKGRISPVASGAVSEAADHAVKHIIDVYMGPNLDAAAVRAMLDDPQSDFLKRFANICRQDLQAFEMA